MLKDCRKPQTRSTWRRLSTTIFALSLIALVQGCATRTVVAPQVEIPQTFLADELPSWRQWFKDWLSLVQSAADSINGVQAPTTRSQKQ